VHGAAVIQMPIRIMLDSLFMACVTRCCSLLNLHVFFDVHWGTRGWRHTRSDVVRSMAIICLFNVDAFLTKKTP
jgi:hypothetical protein